MVDQLSKLQKGANKGGVNERYPFYGHTLMGVGAKFFFTKEIIECLEVNQVEFALLLWRAQTTWHLNCKAPPSVTDFHP